MGEWIEEGHEDWVRWTLGAGVLGWVSEERAGVALGLEAKIRLLTEEVARLDEVVAAARDEGLAAGRAEAADEVGEVIAELRGLAPRLLRRATDAALDVAGALVADAYRAEPERARAALATLLSEPGAERAERIRVAECLVGAVRGFVSGAIPVEGDSRLPIGDVVIETPDGKLERRVSSVLADWAPIVAEFINEPDAG